MAIVGNEVAARCFEPLRRVAFQQVWKESILLFC